MKEFFAVLLIGAVLLALPFMAGAEEIWKYDGDLLIGYETKAVVKKPSLLTAIDAKDAGQLVSGKRKQVFVSSELSESKGLIFDFPVQINSKKRVVEVTYQNGNWKERIINETPMQYPSWEMTMNYTIIALMAFWIIWYNMRDRRNKSELLICFLALVVGIFAAYFLRNRTIILPGGIISLIAIISSSIFVKHKPAGIFSYAFPIVIICWITVFAFHDCPGTEIVQVWILLANIITSLFLSFLGIWLGRKTRERLKVKEVQGGFT